MIVISSLGMPPAHSKYPFVTYALDILYIIYKIYIWINIIYKPIFTLYFAYTNKTLLIFTKM